MASDGLKVDVKGADEVAKFIKRMPETLFDRAKKYFSKAVTDAQTEIQGRLDGSPLNTRSGALSRSMKTQVSGSNVENLKASVFSAAKDEKGNPVVYAPVHELGATIRAKNAYKRLKGGPYLNIPTEANKQPSGVQRRTAKQVFMQGGTIGEDDAGRFGVLLNGQLMFTFAKKVTIPARLGMREAAENQIPTLLSNLQKMELE